MDNEEDIYYQMRVTTMDNKIDTVSNTSDQDGWRGYVLLNVSLGGVIQNIVWTRCQTNKQTNKNNTCSTLNIQLQHSSHSTPCAVTQVWPSVQTGDQIDCFQHYVYNASLGSYIVLTLILPIVGWSDQLFSALCLWCQFLLYHHLPPSPKPTCSGLT